MYTCTALQLYHLFVTGYTGERYYQYYFKHQPSHEDCDRITKASPAVLFTHYTGMYCEYNWDDLFESLFQGCKCDPTLSQSLYIYIFIKMLLTCLLLLLSCVMHASIRTSQRATVHCQRLGGHQTSNRCCNGGPLVPALHTFFFTCTYTFTFCSFRKT